MKQVKRIFFPTDLITRNSGRLSGRAGVSEWVNESRQLNRYDLMGSGRSVFTLLCASQRGVWAVGTLQTFIQYPYFLPATVSSFVSDDNMSDCE